MKTALAKLLIVISVSAMVALVIVGAYTVAVQSQSNPILAPPAPLSIKHLPNQMPSKMPGKHFVRPTTNSDSPMPR
jgi:hypothetical protein